MDALARCVGDAEEFLAARFTRAPHLWRSGSFDDLLSLADVDAQLSTAGLRRPAVRVVRGGEGIDPSLWTRRARTGATTIDDLVHPGRLFGHFDEGATIVLQSLQRWWAPLTRFCREIERAVGHAVQANAYLTPPDAVGLAPHHDTHDVFVLQLHGVKHWTVREALVVDPLEQHRSDHDLAALQPVLFETELHPGDCLYLPRGVVHSAATQQGASLHLTIGVLAATVHDVLVRLVRRAAEEAAFRRPVHGRHDTPDDRRKELAEVVASFGAWVDGFDVADLPDAEVDTLLSGSPRRAPLLDGQLVELVALPDLSDDTVVRVRGDLPVRVGADGAAEVELGDRTLRLPAALAPVLQLVLDGEAHRVDELGAFLDPPSRAVLVRRLIREGALRTSDGT